jgi:HEPN domain-containing protein
VEESKEGYLDSRTLSLFKEFLLSAWNDFYSDFYDWCVYKIKKAGSMLLMRYLMPLVGRVSERSLSYLVAYASGACTELSELLNCSQLVDNLTAPLDVEEIYLNVVEDRIASKADALSAFECVLRLESSLMNCKSTLSPKDPLAEAISAIKALEKEFDEVTILGLKDLYLVVANEFRGLRYRQRISLITDKLTLVPLILLTPEEAFSLIRGTVLSEESLEAIRDDFNILRALGTR